MKKNLFALIALLTMVSVIFSSCGEKDNEDGTFADPDMITEGNFTMEKVPGDAPTHIAENPSQNNSDESTTEEPSSESTYEGTLIGYTSKNYPITEKDGLIYVDGVLIANKTYALPESYNPGDILSECQTAFDKLQTDCAAEGLSIWNASGFRSYETQAGLYNRYCNRDGKEAADRYSARPGHSEHQTGLAIDLNTITQSFADTAEGQWIAENCWRYGFIIRYPKGKEAQTGYMYEPWHIRYVGVEVAEKIYNSGLCLEEYYGITSEYAADVPEEETTTEAPSEPDTTVSEEITTEVQTTEVQTVETVETTQEEIQQYG